LAGFSGCDPPLANGDYALTKVSVCSGTTQYRYNFEPDLYLRLLLTPTATKTLDLEYIGTGWSYWTFRNWSTALFDCNGLVDYALTHVLGTSCNAANASVVLNPSS
jgi:hypothetical protein